jgi:hypothetical protein
MGTKTRARFVGLASVALLVTIVGELLSTTLLVAIGTASFFLAVAGLFALMTATLILGVNWRSGPEMYDPALTDRPRS